MARGGGGHLGLASALLYAGTAISMNFVNKATLDAYPLAWTLLLLQMLATVTIISPLWVLGAVRFPALSARKALQLAPVTIFYTSNTAFALLGLRSLNIPMFSTLKRLTPMIVLMLKSIATKSVPTRGVTMSVMCVVAGCIIAGAGDLTFDLTGYSCALMSCGLQATYLLLVEFSGSKQNIGSAEMLFYNGMLSIPFLAAMVIISGEVSHAVPVLSAAMQASGSFGLLLASCSILGTLLNLSLFLCTINNSALTTTIVGVLKGVLATVLGFFLLGGVQFNIVNVAGIALNTVGGVSYTAIRYRDKRINANVRNKGKLNLSPTFMGPSKTIDIVVNTEPSTFNLDGASSSSAFERGMSSSPLTSPGGGEVHLSAARERHAV